MNEYWTVLEETGLTRRVTPESVKVGDTVVCVLENGDEVTAKVVAVDPPNITCVPKEIRRGTRRER